MTPNPPKRAIPRPPAQTFYAERTVPAWRAWQLSSLLVCATALGGFWALTGTGGEARSVAMTTPGAPPHFTLLVAGRDIVYCYYRTPCKDQNQRTGLWQPPNTDTLMLMKVDGTRVDVLSIPRDTNVGEFNPALGVSAQKINSFYFREGPSGLARAVETVTGEHVDAYAIVRTDFVERVVDALGGLDVTVPDVPSYGDPKRRGIHFDDNAANLHVHLDPGAHHLDGQAAVAFLRMRKGFGDDYGRMDHQKQAISQLASKLKTPAGLAALPTILGGLQDGVETNVDPTLLQQVQPYLSSFKLAFATLPTNEIPGVSNLAPDRAALARIWGVPADTNVQNARVHLVDASGANLGGPLARLLRASGYTVRTVETAPLSRENSQVFTLDAVGAAERLADQLGLPRLQGLRFPVQSGEIGVYLGQDAQSAYPELARINAIQP
ncbi:LCP family protein [Deinococcus maricopensis]|uniref:Cell envelope-related transcriptional attenuator n=1 Tax=Deinococcus maricopensis (strain DSM 21211 / LMG 22137 / NRRL B-23946 / LB-34) TaxID=709986 RepID=E8U3Q8_DEIML|nr:LCP family protein [Deinococcus maricopensis]ADV68751.1 cell envelope-related transcriptional attenuator [Deinococcus maricopensis DSM 21211]